MAAMAWLPSMDGNVRIDEAAPGIDQNPGGVDADAFQHGAQQRGLVFAVAVAVAEDVIRGVGLIAADADLDADIADVALHVAGDALDLRGEVGSGRRRVLWPWRLRSGVACALGEASVVYQSPMAVQRASPVGCGSCE